MQSKTFKVPSISCGHCVHTIQFVLLLLPFLTACGGSDAPPPSLGETGQPTLVYIYTDN